MNLFGKFQYKHFEKKSLLNDTLSLAGGRVLIASN